MMKPQEAMSESAINQILEGLDTTKLGDWERGFVTNVKAYWKKNRRLSEKQSKRLSELWRKQHEPK